MTFEDFKNINFDEEEEEIGYLKNVNDEASLPDVFKSADGVMDDQSSRALIESKSRSRLNLPRTMSKLSFSYLFSDYFNKGKCKRQVKYLKTKV